MGKFITIPKNPRKNTRINIGLVFLGTWHKKSNKMVSQFSTLSYNASSYLTSLKCSGCIVFIVHCSLFIVPCSLFLGININVVSNSYQCCSKFLSMLFVNSFTIYPAHVYGSSSCTECSRPLYIQILRMCLSMSLHQKGEPLYAVVYI